MFNIFITPVKSDKLIVKFWVWSPQAMLNIYSKNLQLQMMSRKFGIAKILIRHLSASFRQILWTLYEYNVNKYPLHYSKLISELFTFKLSLMNCNIFSLSEELRRVCWHFLALIESHSRVWGNGRRKWRRSVATSPWCWSWPRWTCCTRPPWIGMNWVTILPGYCISVIVLRLRNCQDS